MTLFERIREAIEKRLAHHAANKTDVDAHDMAQHVHEAVQEHEQRAAQEKPGDPAAENSALAPEQPAKTEEGA